MTRYGGGDSFGGSTRHSPDPWMPKRRSTRPAADPAGTTALLAGYRDFVAIARSDSSEIYRAHQDGLDRPVAIKVLLLDDEEAVTRFEREVIITVQLGRQHPHIVTVIDTGATATGRPCIVMEYYDLGSLHDRLRAHGPLDWGEVLTVGTVVADALSFAHRHGVLHRDVKPQNILVLPTSYVVADFGIARRIDAARTSSVEWFSFRHASPEMLDGEPPAVADDIWSIGSTLFTLLDGRPPFAAEGDGQDGEDTALAYMKRVRTGRPRELRRADVPPGLVAVIDQCLQRQPADRFPDAAALHAALTAVAAETRAWAPSGDAATPGDAPLPSTEPDATAFRAGAGLAAERPQVVPIRPAPLVPQPPPANPAAPQSPSRAAATAPPSPPPTPAAPPTSSPAAEGPTAATPGAASPATMAHLIASTFVSGGDATGAGHATGADTGADTGGRYPPGGPPPALADVVARPARTRSPRRILLVTAVAVTVGGVLGIGGTWVAQMARSAAGQARPVPTSGTGGSASAPGATPGAPPPAAPNINSTRIAPTITQLDGRRTGVFLRWQDPSQGEAQFVVVQVVDGEGDPKRTLPPGTTQVAIEGLDPATAPYCFLVIAVVGQERGVSPTRCTEIPA